MPDNSIARQYKAEFDFTTVRGNFFTARTGELCFETDQTLKQVTANKNELIPLVVKFIHSKKPKWNVFLVNIKSIKHV